MVVLELLATLIGGGAGAVLRYVVGGWVNHRMGPGFPWGTLAVNTLGCFGLGFLEGAAPHEKVLLLVLGAGVIAGFTTFSTLMLETLNLALAKERRGEPSFALVLGEKQICILEGQGMVRREIPFEQLLELMRACQPQRTNHVVHT